MKLTGRRAKSWDRRGTVDVELCLEVEIRSKGNYTPATRDSPPEHEEEREIIAVQTAGGEALDDELVEMLKPYIVDAVGKGKCCMED
jgi:hypothetical protein